MKNEKFYLGTLKTGRDQEAAQENSRLAGIYKALGKGQHLVKARVDSSGFSG